MTHETTAYTDSRSEQIERNLGPEIAAYADANLAGWVLDLLADATMNPAHGPLGGFQVCLTAAALGTVLPDNLKALAAVQAMTTDPTAWLKLQARIGRIDAYRAAQNGAAFLAR